MSKLLAGRYELVDKIGEGGMAVVYRAKDRLLNRYVAIKVLRPEYTRDEQFLESFKRESQAAAGLQHPNIVSVYDVGKTGNINYIVMELVDGRPLSEIIEEQAPLEYTEVIEISKQIASALSEAHKHQIIHRDVKPHNILVTKDGVAKLTDFGIAKAVSNSSVMTDTSKIIGSVHYFSPEQARGSYVDERSDIYSLGIVMYEMLTGRVPFDGDNPVEVALKHINEEIIPPSKLVKGIPPNLEKMVMKATDKFQTNRYKSADEMLEDIDNIEFVRRFISSVASMDSGSGISSSGIKGKPIDEKEYGRLSRGESTGFAGYSNGQNKNDNRGSKNNTKKIVGIVAGVLAGLVALLLLLRVFGIIGGTSDEIKVPDLTNKTYEEAEAELTALGLTINKGDDISSDDVEEGKVAQQMPIAGSNVKKGKVITVRLSSGPGEIEVPDLKNKTYEDAEAVLKKLGLKIAKGEDVYSDSIEVGKIVNQTPAAKSKAKQDEIITVQVSKGKESKTTKVPDLTGSMYTSRDEMDTYLASFGLKLGEVVESESAMAPGTITDQSPAANTEVAKDTYVDILIAVEPKEVTVTVPSLTGMTINEATFICEDRGLAVVVGGFVDDPTGTGIAGTVIDQDIAADSEVAQGTTITIYVIKEPEPTEPTEPDPTEPTEGGTTTEEP
ncbi:MAG: Stk1 family PASTA domain-containing Ser/Thr kinase [Firmicutes bacterium]|nr:Stk1 family PASTA domain-containing Ser/Thr kinase [Bacillota bacterium]